MADEGGTFHVMLAVVRVRVENGADDEGCAGLMLASPKMRTVSGATLSGRTSSMSNTRCELLTVEAEVSATLGSTMPTSCMELPSLQISRSDDVRYICPEATSSSALLALELTWKTWWLAGSGGKGGKGTGGGGEGEGGAWPCALKSKARSSMSMREFMRAPKRAVGPVSRII